MWRGKERRPGGARHVRKAKLESPGFRLDRDQFTDSWASREDEIEGYSLQTIRVGHVASERGRLMGDVENGVLPAGQSSGLIKEVLPAGEVVRRTVEEAVEVLRRVVS